mmetsp:Transcript_16113/g.21086  ORF Transcript_16113/g.21086 Transcript_16113/m.21086 type:complete len:397 (+) Transcript_16113:548-1738(+)
MKTARSAVTQDDHDASQDERNQTELGQSSIDFTQINPASKEDITSFSTAKQGIETFDMTMKSNPSSMKPVQSLDSSQDASDEVKSAPDSDIVKKRMIFAAIKENFVSKTKAPVVSNSEPSAASVDTAPTFNPPGSAGELDYQNLLSPGEVVAGANSAQPPVLGHEDAAFTGRTGVSKSSKTAALDSLSKLKPKLTMPNTLQSASGEPVETPEASRPPKKLPSKSSIRGDLPPGRKLYDPGIFPPSTPPDVVSTLLLPCRALVSTGCLCCRSLVLSIVSEFDITVQPLDTGQDTIDSVNAANDSDLVKKQNIVAVLKKYFVSPSAAASNVNPPGSNPKLGEFDLDDIDSTSVEDALLNAETVDVLSAEFDHHFLVMRKSILLVEPVMRSPHKIPLRS